MGAAAGGDPRTQPSLGPVGVAAPQAGSAAGRSQGLPLLPSWQPPAFRAALSAVSGRFRAFPVVHTGWRVEGCMCKHSNNLGKTHVCGEATLLMSAVSSARA